ncbi:VOC family protein [Flagellimonas sp. GZD32]|uniref:VOC family protein n=1 Tax=Flagellimonas cixiensis TaxID=3228750 RepID=UPI0035C93479
MEPTRIDYIEFKSTDLLKTKAFYHAAFGWNFTDYGPTYCAFSESGIAGGFELTSEAITNGVLVVLYHTDLFNIKARIMGAGGKITKDIFSFPGGRRFHFKDPSGNELAVWSKT